MNNLQATLQTHGELLPTLYNAQAAQGWEQGMLAITQAVLGNLLSPTSRVLEIGCGGDFFLRHQQQHFPHQQLVGVDLHPAALPQAQIHTSGLAGLARGNLLELPFASDAFDAVVALDVFDQVEVSLFEALVEARRVLQPGGIVLLRVSAYPWLYGKHDIAFGTGRRFTALELENSVVQAGFRQTRLTFANSLLALPLMAVRLLQNWEWIGFEESSYQSTFSNRLIERVLRLESKLLSWIDFPIGLSLYIVARK